MMKKLVISCLMVMILFITGVFETEAARITRFGIKGGMQTGDGYKVGVFTEFKLGGKLSIQPELLYAHRRFKYTAYDYFYGQQPLISMEKYDAIDQLEVPLLLKYKVNLTHGLDAVLYSGPYVAFHLNEKALGSSMQNFSTELPGYIEPNRKYAATDAGLVLGTGFEWGKGKVKLVMDFRVNLGFRSMQLIDPLEYYQIITDIQPYEQNKPYNEIFFKGYYERRRNRSLSVFVGVSF